MAASDHLGIQFDVQPGKVTATHPLYGKVGELSWSGDAVRNVAVGSDYRHQGIATELYRRASDHAGLQLGHSRFRTDDAEGWASKVGGHIPERA